MARELFAGQTRMRSHIKHADVKVYMLKKTHTHKTVSSRLPAFQTSSWDVTQKDFHFYKSKKLEDDASYCARQENIVNDY